MLQLISNEADILKLVTDTFNGFKFYFKGHQFEILNLSEPDITNKQAGQY
jgi:hypothetical protein